MATARYVNKINGTVVVTSTRKNKIYEKLSASTFYMETLLLQMYAHYHSFILSEEYWILSPVLRFAQNEYILNLERKLS